MAMKRGLIPAYERRAALAAALAAFTDDPEKRRRYLQYKADCETLIRILTKIERRSMTNDC